MQTVRYGALVLGVLVVSLLGWGIYVNNAAAWVRVGLSLAAAVVIECFVVFYRNSKVPVDRSSGRCLRLTGLIHGQEVDGGAEGVDSYYSSLQTWGGIARIIPGSSDNCATPRGARWI